MNKALFGALVASTFGLSALSAISADLTDSERSELRARAEGLQANRAHAGQVQTAGDVKLDRARGDVHLSDRGDVQMKHSRIRKAKPTHSRKTRFKESLKQVPGALVRGR